MDVRLRAARRSTAENEGGGVNENAKLFHLHDSAGKVIGTLICAGAGFWADGCSSISEMIRVVLCDGSIALLIVPPGLRLEEVTI